MKIMAEKEDGYPVKLQTCECSDVRPEPTPTTTSVSYPNTPRVLTADDLRSYIQDCRSDIEAVSVSAEQVIKRLEADAKFSREELRRQCDHIDQLEAQLADAKERERVAWREERETACHYSESVWGMNAAARVRDDMPEVQP